jgi:TonB family protein
VSASDRQSNLKQHSTVFASGGVSKRRWLNPPAVLRSWSAADLLTNSVVRVVVDADGLVFSTALLPPGSGSKAADQSALEMARSARFAPLPRHAKQMTGTLVFEWHTVPLAETNSPASKP